MSKKRHPLLLALIVIFFVGLFLGGVVFFIQRAFRSDLVLPFSEKIGVIQVQGEILTSSTLISQIETFRKNKSIKAIVLRINSPGGAVGPAQEIYRELERTRKFKKVVVSMGSVAASGGYYIASAADKIVAEPGTITGSIGVIMHLVRVQDLLSKIGVDFEVLKSGEFKDTGSPYRKLTDRERELLTSILIEIKRQFVEDVARGRGLKTSDVMKVADGRILLGSQAKELGLVDEMGNFYDAVELAKRLAGIKGEVTLVYPPKKRYGLIDLFMKSMISSFIKEIKNMNGMEFRCDTILHP